MAEQETEAWWGDWLHLLDTAGESARFPLPPSPSSVVTPAEAVERLGQIDWAFAGSPTDDLSHGIHPYPAKFTPALPAALISQLSLPGDLVLDPFGGSGTTAVEALVQGRRCISTDVNPLAEVIGLAKTASLGPWQLTVLGELADTCLSAGRYGSVACLLESAGSLPDGFVPEIPHLEKWFAPGVTRELAYLRWRISGLVDPDAQAVARCVFSGIIVRVSFQDGETRYAARPRRLLDGAVLAVFGRDLGAALRRLRETARHLRLRRAEFRTVDARSADPAPPGSVDLIVTSPPYPNATDYHLYHRFRLFWLGFDPRALSGAEIGSHLRHQREKTDAGQYAAEMQQCLERCYRVLRPGRYAAFVVGDGLFSGQLYQTARHLADLAAGIGYDVVTAFDRPLPAHRRAFGPGARRADRETVLLLRRPDTLLTVQLVPAAYRRWPYEDELRRAEAGRLVRQTGGTLLGGDLTVQVAASALPAFRRLTFTRAVRAPGCADLPTWQSVLEQGEGPARRKDPKYATHGIHPYKGKFYPQLVKSLFNVAGLPPGSVILDPCVGSGTTTLEAYLNGYAGRGVDLSPLAAEMADVKTGILQVDPAWLQHRLHFHAAEVRQLAAGPALPGPWDAAVAAEVAAWFPEPVVRKLAAVLEGIRRVPDSVVQRLLRLVLSGLLRQCSQQEPADLRVRRRAEPIADAPLVDQYLAAVARQQARLLHLAQRLAYCPQVPAPAAAWAGDTRDFQTFAGRGLGGGAIDAIITSPPYATALPYIDTDRLSLMALWNMPAPARARLEQTLIGSRELIAAERKALDEQVREGGLAEIPSPLAQAVIAQIDRLNRPAAVGFRRRNMAALLYRYFRDMNTAFAVWDRLLRPGGTVMVVIGDNRTVAGGGTEVTIPTTRILTELAAAMGWRVRVPVDITVTRQALLHARNTITRNTVLWFERGGR